MSTTQHLLWILCSVQRLWQTFSNSAFCPHSVFMCFVWIWEQTAIISLYSINWLGFVTETVFTARYGLGLYISYRLIYAYKGLNKTEFQFRHPVLLFSPTSDIPPMFHAQLHLNAVLIRRTSGLNQGTFNIAVLFQLSRNIGQEYNCHTVLF